MDNVDRTLVIWIKDGDYRKEILKMLEEKPMLPSEVAERLEIHRSSTSRLLKRLKEKGLIENITSESRTVEYSLSKKGKKYLTCIS